MTRSAELSMYCGQLRTYALLAPVTLLAGGSAPAMRGRANVLCTRFRGVMVTLDSVLCGLDFCGRVLFVSGIAHCRGGMCFVVTLRGLLFLFFFLGRFLDAAELPQKFFPLLGGLPAAGELHGEDLLDDLVEPCSTRHPQRFQLGGYNGKSDANRAPLVQKSPNLRKGGRFIGFGHQVRDLIEWKFLEKLPLDQIAYLMAESNKSAALSKIRAFLNKWRPIRIALPVVATELEALGMPRGTRFDQIVEQVFAMQLTGRGKTPEEREKLLRKLSGIKEPPKKKEKEKKPAKGHDKAHAAAAMGDAAHKKHSAAKIEAAKHAVKCNHDSTKPRAKHVGPASHGRSAASGKKSHGRK